MFITSFLTSFIPTKTIYGVIRNNYIRFKESKINQLFSLIFLKPTSQLFFAHEQVFADFGYAILCILSYRCCEFRFSIFFTTFGIFLINSTRLQSKFQIATIMFKYRKIKKTCLSYDEWHDSPWRASTASLSNFGRRHLTIPLQYPSVKQKNTIRYFYDLSFFRKIREIFTDRYNIVFAINLEKKCILYL